MRVRPLKSRKGKRVTKKQSLKKNLMLLFLSLLFLAVSSSLFYMATAQHLYKPIEWRINKMAMKAPEAPAASKSKKEMKESPKVAAAGMDYLFWKILREEEPEKKH